MGVELQVEACVRPDVVPNTNEIIIVPDEAGEDSLPPLHGEVHSRGHLKNTEGEEHSSVKYRDVEGIGVNKNVPYIP